MGRESKEKRGHWDRPSVRFYYDIPIQGGKPLSKNMKLFAPVTKKVGLHWHHFNQPILPPVVDVDQASKRKIQNNKVIVYLPFEETDKLTSDLQKISDHEFMFIIPSSSIPTNEIYINEKSLERLLKTISLPQRL